LITVPDLAAGIDSGRYAGVALVGRKPDGFKLNQLWLISSANDALWLSRLLEAFKTIDEERKGHKFRFIIEQPPKTLRAGSVAGDRRGHTTWKGMGRRLGMIEATWFFASGLLAEKIEQKDWVNRMSPIVLRKKSGDGTHRCREAARLVQGAEEALLQIPEHGRIDCAEAILIGTAAQVGPAKYHYSKTLCYITCLLL
jgi:hypothetical protein